MLRALIRHSLTRGIGTTRTIRTTCVQGVCVFSLILSLSLPSLVVVFLAREKKGEKQERKKEGGEGGRLRQTRARAASTRSMDAATDSILMMIHNRN